MLLREWLAKKQISRNRFSEMVGVSGPYMGKLMSRKQSPSLVVAQLIYELSEGEVCHDELLTDDEIREIIKRGI